MMPISSLLKTPAHPHTAIYGCGNVLFGDDGVGPAVIAALKKLDLPKDTIAQDVGTSIRDMLFDYLLAPELGPRRIIIIDAVDHPGRKPGEVFEITPTTLPSEKIHDFSLHQFPTVNMLAELAEATDIEVRILAVQVQSIPEEVRPGLSKPVARAIDKVCSRVMEILSQDKTSEVKGDDVRIPGK